MLCVSSILQITMDRSSRRLSAMASFFFLGCIACTTKRGEREREKDGQSNKQGRTMYPVRLVLRSAIKRKRRSHFGDRISFGG